MIEIVLVTCKEMKVFKRSWRNEIICGKLLALDLPRASSDISIKSYYAKYFITGMHGCTCEAKEARSSLEIFLPLLSYFNS